MATDPYEPLNNAFWAGLGRSSRIVERIVVEGTLVLQEPAHFGNGDAGETTDLPLLTDAYDPTRPLLTGASLAGALRSYLRAREFGHCEPERPKAERTSAAVLLFGGSKGDDDGDQSLLIVDDALGENAPVEVRDGVRLNAATRTAADEGLFTAECWAAGTEFPLRFELLVRDDVDRQALTAAFFTALKALEEGEITLGGRKQRGYGKVVVRDWRVRTFDLRKPAALLAWISEGGSKLEEKYQEDLASTLGRPGEMTDKRTYFKIAAEFVVPGAFLIRSGSGGASGPDAVQLCARVLDEKTGKVKTKPVLSGTALAGALRARARKIVNTLDRDETLVEGIFGSDMKRRPEKPEASRLRLRQSVIEGGERGLIQHRIAIDRFTGGVMPGALFNEQPLFGNGEAKLQLEMTLVKPAPEEIGLLLLLLKDLWTEDLPIGGTQSVGRGRLLGESATLRHRTNGENTIWKITGDGLCADEEKRQRLEGFVSAFANAKEKESA